MNYFIDMFRNCFNFKGKLSRKGFWMAMLFFYIFLIITYVLDFLFGTELYIKGISLGYGYITIIYLIACMIPSFSAYIRRLHDVGKKGIWLLLLLVPVIGAFMALDFDSVIILTIIFLLSISSCIWLFVLICLPGKKVE